MITANDFNLVIATENDLDDLIKLENECFPQDRIKPKEFRELIKRSSAEIYCLKYQDRLIGTAIVIFKKAKKTCRLYSFCLTSEFRDKGLSHVFLESIEQFYAHTGYVSMSLEVKENHKEAYFFYIDRSYFSVGKYSNYYEDGSTARRMRKLLNPVKLEQTPKVNNLNKKILSCYK